jgi:hypothetical protein
VSTSTAFSVTRAHERVQIRAAARNHVCWSWREKCKAPGEGYDDRPRCTRVIAKGEPHVVSTIYPGHDSGYADDRLKLVAGEWVPVPPSPVTSHFCMPCGRRWKNLAGAVAELEATEVAP